MPTQLLPGLISALAGPDSDAAIEAGLGVLREHGLVLSEQPTAANCQPWLVLRHGNRSFTFTVNAGSTPPDLAIREQVALLLELALRRAAEHDEARRMHERWELLANAS